jgi:carbamoyl-phosphate synthase large subunit
MKIKNKRIFISGGAGVIGKSLTLKLHELGATIFVGDLKPKPNNFPKDIIYRKGDLNFITKEELEKFQPQIFFHLAATFERTFESYDFRAENHWHNVNLGYHILSLLKDSKYLERVVFASSYLIYDSQNYLFDNPQKKPVFLNEEMHVLPRNLTGSAKLSHEIDLRFLSSFDNIKFNYVSARIFRVYGENSKDVISRWVRELISNQEISVYNKEGIFDYIYSEDVSKGLIELAVSKLNGIVNLGSGKPNSINDVLVILKKYFPNMKIFEKKNNANYEASAADLFKLKKYTNWIPKVSLEEGIKNLIEYEKNNYKAIIIEKKNVLVTSIASKISLIKSIREAIQKFGENIDIVGGDYDENCLGRYFVDRYWKMPLLKDLEVKDLIKYCHENHISWVIPTRDEDLEYFSKIDRVLSLNKINVMVSAEETIKKCNDKLIFYQAMKDITNKIIPTFKNLKSISSERIVVKERNGSGSKDIALNLTKPEAMRFAKKLNNPIFQPYIKGREFTVDTYFTKQKKLKGIIIRERLKVVNGESHITKIVSDQKLESLIEGITHNFNFFGHINFQIIKDDLDNYNIIECNCRFGGASFLSVNAGLDSFYWFLLETSDNNIDDYPFNRSHSDKMLVKYPSDLIIEVLKDA